MWSAHSIRLSTLLFHKGKERNFLNIFFLHDRTWLKRSLRVPSKHPSIPLCFPLRTTLIRKTSMIFNYKHFVSRTVGLMMRYKRAHILFQSEAAGEDGKLLQNYLWRRSARWFTGQISCEFKVLLGLNTSDIFSTLLAGLLHDLTHC